MANCLLKSDILTSNTCGYTLKKVIDVYLANFSEVSGSTIGNENGGTEVKTITMAAGGRFYKIDVAEDSASFTDELVVGANGGKYRNHTITFSVGGNYDASMADTLDALSLGKYLAVAHLADDSYILLGRIAGVTASVANLQGSATADGESGITVTLNGNAVEVALPLSDEAVETVKKNVTD